MLPPHEDGHDHSETRIFDVRESMQVFKPTEDQINAVSKLGSKVHIKWNEKFGTPSMIVKNEGYLTAATSGDAVTIARNWLEENAAIYGLTAADIANFKVIRDFELPGTGLHPVTFQQTFNGIESVYGGRIIVAVNRDGKILSVTGNPSRSAKLIGEYKLTAADALMKAVALHKPIVNFMPEALEDENGWDVFSGLEVFPTVQRVKKAAFITNDGVRPAFRVLYVEELDKGFEIVIDAETGKKLYQRSLVDHLTGAAEGLIFENFPGSKDGGGYQTVKSFAGDPIASPLGWIFSNTGATSVTTLGNNADTFANWSNFLAPEAPGVVRPYAVNGKFKYTFKDAWATTNNANPEGTVATSYSEDVYSATTNLFYHHNLFHDYLYNLGWTEPAGNMQATNMGRGGLDGDPILGLVQAGALSGGAPTYTGRDNAYMLTLPDGTAAWSGMFLWEPIAGAFEGAYADGDFDAGIIYHEYSHALSNRYVAGGEALGSHQAGSMGEAWGDFFAMHYLMKEGLQKEPVVGAYVTNNNERGIRNYSLSESPYNFGDIGYDILGPQVHADGEIWSSILWHVRTALIDEYGKAEGEKVIEHLVMDAMPISTPDPSFDEMRTAIIAAEYDRYGGKYSNTIWKAFAQRGLGEGAISDGNDTDVTTTFKHPDATENGKLVGTFINKDTKEPLEGIRVIVGQFEARTSEVVKTDENGNFAFDIVDGTYDITVQAQGFGSHTFKNVIITKGKTTKLNKQLSPNLASMFNGATISPNSTDEQESNPLKNAIDDTEGSVYASSVQENGFMGTEFIVDLAGDEPVTISHIQVSAFKDIAKSRYATLKDFEVQVSEDGLNWQTVVDDTFTYGLPRPATPDLHYRGFDINPVTAKYLKLVAKSSQYNGKGYIQVGEIQAFSSKSNDVEQIEIAPLPDFESGPFTILGGNAANGIGQLAGVDATGGVTENEFITTQNPNPVSQGVDGYVITLPSNDGDRYNYGGYNVSVIGDNSTALDLDVYFYDKNFSLIGSIATSGANESGVIPGGTRYIFVALYTGANVTVNVKAISPY
ncbi:coagulation factor 5/8 type-like protein [Lottiidibacillus patelloidae]|uniref:Coagulation factor 5/8 type-like protein n=2 Tax=Lottiidibacillus patelloidae TaxID=2670334 RepID=A0A263BSY8_9BACI|nr:coagulation factor 5/8 type-like protein [Lottiidibacillus patelloidae]